jgi:predicted anti-sigma-YlaC factor YlaD
VRTFGGLAGFLALFFLLFGLYLLGDAFENPLAAQPIGVLAAAFSITLAVIMLFYLLKPGHKQGA